MSTVTADKRSEMTAREYAVSIGLAKMGRGKMSAPAYAAIAEAESEGVTFKEPAHVTAARERSENPKRKRKGANPVNAEVVANSDGAEIRVTDDGRTQERHGEHWFSPGWFQKTMYFGAFVCNPEGKTLRVISERPNAEGFTYFIDVNGKQYKAKVHARWGVRQGWPLPVNSSN